MQGIMMHSTECGQMFILFVSIAAVLQMMQIHLRQTANPASLGMSCKVEPLPLGPKFALYIVRVMN